MGDLVQTITSINTKGGDYFSYKRVTSVGADKDPADTWHSGTWRLGSEGNFDQPTDIIRSESGKQLTTEDGDVTTEILINSAQFDAATINFLKDEVPGTYFAVMLDAGLGADGKKLEIFIPLAKFARSIKWTAPGRKPQFRIIPLANPVAVTPATVPTWTEGAASAFATPIDGYFKAAETTPS